ncbi:hypothetical protein [uncultured Mameliella sp.]|uniref:hypothetical protein n=1 Tax=uncultured Mameliella sp. TaxID=1447087 RepID=UPI00261A0402|nr:hypothetical protein [uncultured Mameliella sp.]
MRSFIRIRAPFLLIASWVALSLFCLFFLKNTEAFQRAGSFGVAVTIIAFALTYSEIKDIECELEGLLGRAKDFDPSASEVVGIHKIEASLTSMDIRTKSLQTKVRTAELIALVTSTIQWGYGDLVPVS